MTSSTVVTALLNWFEAHGGKNPKLEIRYLGELEGHGVYTKQALKRTETTIQVPFQLTMSIKSAAQSDLSPVFQKYHQIPDDEILALHLMHERTKGKNSFFAPFIASLPTTFDLPVFWTATELHELQGTNVVLLTQLMQKQLQHDFESIHQAVITDFPAIFRALPTLTLHDYTWAMSVIWSRAFGITRKATYVRVLCPILDMFNHDSRVCDPLDDFVSYDPKKDILRHHVPHDVVANSALTISYGLYSNAKLLYSYGFVTKENNHRVLDFWMKLPRNDPQWKRKQLLLDSNELTNNQTYDFRGTLFLKDVDERLLATLRVIVANEHEWNLLDKVLHGIEFKSMVAWL